MSALKIFLLSTLFLINFCFKLVLSSLTIIKASDFLTPVYKDSLKGPAGITKPFLIPLTPSKIQTEKSFLTELFCIASSITTTPCLRERRHTVILSASEESDARSFTSPAALSMATEGRPKQHPLICVLCAETRLGRRLCA